MKKYLLVLIPFAACGAVSLLFLICRSDDTYYGIVWFVIGVELSIAFFGLLLINDIFDRVVKWQERRQKRKLLGEEREPPSACNGEKVSSSRFLRVGLFLGTALGPIGLGLIVLCRHLGISWAYTLDMEANSQMGAILLMYLLGYVLSFLGAVSLIVATVAWMRGRKGKSA